MRDTCHLFEGVDWGDLEISEPTVTFTDEITLHLVVRSFGLTEHGRFDEAAEMDGANSFRILWQILVPLCAPALTTVAIFSSLEAGSWCMKRTRSIPSRMAMSRPRPAAGPWWRHTTSCPPVSWPRPRPG